MNKTQTDVKLKSFIVVQMEQNDLQSSQKQVKKQQEQTEHSRAESCTGSRTRRYHQVIV